MFTKFVLLFALIKIKVQCTSKLKMSCYVELISGLYL